MTTRDKLKILRKEAEEYERFLSKFDKDTKKSLRDYPFGEPLSEDTVKKLIPYAGSKDPLVNRCMMIARTTPDPTHQKLMLGYASETVKMTLCSLAVADRWSDCKVCYGFTEEMIAALRDGAEDTDTKDIPTEALIHLPYKTFFIDGSYIGDEKYLGIIVERDEKDHNLHLDIMRYEENQLLMNTLTVPLMEKQTMGQLYEKTKCKLNELHEGTKKDADMLGLFSKTQNSTDEKIKKAYDVQGQELDICFQALPLVLYLATEKPDVKQLRAPQDHKSRSGNGKAAEVSRYTVGEEFSLKYRKFEETCKVYKQIKGLKDDGVTEVLRQMPPHVRRAHYHHHWVGSDLNPEKNGPRRLRLDWQEPTFVHLELKDLIDPVLIEVAQKESEQKKAEFGVMDIADPEPEI